MYAGWTVPGGPASMKSQHPTEKEKLMNLRRLAKDAASKNGGCMALYVDDDNPGMMVGQMRRHRRARRQVVEFRRGEVTGLIPAETVVRAARQYLAEHPEAGAL